ncbi:MAG: 4Fe-4S cluster-binding domain-containing protein [Candidatus Gastranaerophilales bacterium]|nr:4Fe-4S cluster-binding domain-containing protein [Candidatus Gastranaerophilales bacterium]
MNYHNLTYPDMNNGEGLRVVLWLSGCSHHCYNCQNPQTWDENSGIPFDESAKEELFRELDKDYISGLTLTGGDPLYESSLDDVLDLVTEVNKRYNTPQYIEGSNGDNHNISNDNADEIRLSKQQKSICLYTGYTLSTCKYFDNTIFTFHPLYYHLNPFNNKPVKVDDKAFLIKQDKKRLDIIKIVDILVDGKYIDSQRDTTLKWRGSKNQRVINVKKSLQLGEITLWTD